MPIQLLMPALSPTMTEGNLAKWHKKEGDAVKAGDIIAEIETDKATMEFEAVDEGTLGKILVPEGAEGVKVNQPIALLLEEGEDKSALDKAKPAPPPAPKAEAKPAAAAPAASPLPNPPPQAGEGRVGAAPPKTAPAPRAAAQPSAARGNGHALRPFRDHDLADGALVHRLDLHRRLVGLDLGDDVPGGDMIALLDAPFRQRALLHRRRQSRHLDFDRHEGVLDSRGHFPSRRASPGSSPAGRAPLAQQRFARHLHRQTKRGPHAHLSRRDRR